MAKMRLRHLVYILHNRVLILQQELNEAQGGHREKMHIKFQIAEKIDIAKKSPVWQRTCPICANINVLQSQFAKLLF